MDSYKEKFLQQALAVQALRFGQFELKSGRISPYFFNAGFFNTGAALQALGECFAEVIARSDLKPDLLFGPAYKGIPLVATTSAILAHQYKMNLPFAFNRKEVKKHGEGGRFVGADITGRVLILDDVITAGTAISEVMDLLGEKDDCEVIGCVVALDRQEKGKGDLSAVQDVAQRFGIPVRSIVQLTDLIEYIGANDDLHHHLSDISAYHDRYGVQD